MPMKPTMKYKSFALLVCLGGVVFAPSAWADIYVICNPGAALTADDIKNIFTGEKELAGSVKLRVYDNAAVKDEFLGKVLQIDAARYDSLWTKKSFRDGVTPPTVKNNDEEILATVKSTPGAVGYVKAPPPGGVSVLKVF